MADKLQRISIGFHGQALAARVSTDKLGELRSALATGQGGWYELESEDGTVLLDLTKVIFLRLEGGEQRVGFGL
ncbi:MAG: hypothetical protein JWQ48_692 [Conexibacter sp.]|jgi:hypothetical protein|nr:hypothetical protein [Conexibacter sp.]